MVKADVRRDYYADLGLGPSAESEDIKKQFRKLALKYHPDRNPGKEVEFIAKFQAIQAAHEILSDPQQRLRYDTDRLRAGYGRQYAAHARANTSRRTHASHTTASAKPQPFSARAQYANTGPSTGAQRYASYAKAAPQQPWEKKNDDGQTRADAFRGFQGMKNGSPNMSGWSSFDPRTGRSGTTRANGTSTGQTPRTKSAYEYFKASSKPTEGAGTPRSQTTRRKNGFAPGTAGGDEPMAANTSAYTSTPRDSRHSGYFFDNSVPSPTAKRTDGPDLERVRNQYANASGEKTFFSSAWLGRDNARRTSRTNPPSPTPDSDTNRHRSVSPSHLKANRNRHYAPSASSSDADDDDDDDDDTDDDPYERNNASPAPKPKAVPKSRLRRHHYQKPADPRDWSSGTGHDSDSAAAPRNPFAGTFASANFQPEFDPNQTKSSSHGNLRKEFSAKDWQDASQEGWFGFFTPKPSEMDTTRATQSSNNRGRPTTRSSASWARQSAGPSDQDSSQSGSATQQQPTPFVGAKFSADDWVEQFKNLSWAAPTNKGTQTQANAACARSPKKQTRPAASKARPMPQPASVATEAEEEAKATAEDNKDGQQSDKVADQGVEAMDLDDDTPVKPTAAPPAPENKAAEQRSSKQPSSSDGNKTKEADAKDFNLKDLKNTVPFTSTNAGIEDLRDISATLPFESRAKAGRTTARDVRPRELACPNPPKRPRRPALVPIGIGAQLVLPRSAWERYVAEMNTYMREWNEFNRRMLRHFNARQEANETGLAPGWISAVGGSTRLNINGQDDPEDTEDNKGAAAAEDNDDTDVLLPGSAKGGYTAYLRAIEEDVKVRKHWDVAYELHRECILELGELREWLLNGGKLM